GPWHTGYARNTLEYDAAVSRSPWNIGIAEEEARSKAKDVLHTIDRVSIYSRLLNYDVPAMIAALADVRDAAQAQTLAERACALEGEACAEAGSYLASLGRSDPALALGKRALEVTHSQIGLSNNMNWYVSLLQDRGRLAEAMRVAHRMADVYSSKGLQTLAKAHERMGEFKEAAAVFRLIYERYGETRRRDMFFIRHALRYGVRPFEDETREAMAKVFPKGIRRISFERAAEATNPLSLNNRNLFDRDLQTAGVSTEDRVLALDGTVVETEEQYFTALTFTDDPNVTLLLERKGGKVEEVTLKIARIHYDVVAKGWKARI
ncbi:MAG: hypothetical protein ABIR28_00505, partial [Vicinamibacteria bacterium]